MIHITQKELMKKLRSNPLECECYYEDVGKNKAGDYIFLRRLDDRIIYADNQKIVCFNRIELAVYCRAVADRNEICRFISGTFDVPFTYGRSGDIFTASAVLRMIVSDWND